MRVFFSLFARIEIGKERAESALNTQSRIVCSVWRVGEVLFIQWNIIKFYTWTSAWRETFEKRQRNSPSPLSDNRNSTNEKLGAKEKKNVEQSFRGACTRVRWLHGSVDRKNDAHDRTKRMNGKELFAAVRIHTAASGDGPVQIFFNV